jgi:hypothetical protein
MRRLCATLLAATCLSVPVLAHADMTTIMGMGTGSCGGWTAYRVNPVAPTTELDQQWVLGFLSGVGYMGSATIDPLNNTDAQGVYTWIDNFCHEHPLARISDAAGAFLIAHPH